ncbi:MAG: major facilitator superfamily transporter [Rhodobacteraceae bacterium]|uniref:MFS transporter n=1 Tax=Cypionkella sp. TaxID=2811411 RepID=UPI00132C3201|nr:MFS transporter [Cypionkella sp.]KAF0173467.1 MAG: major facilitator superfamily transporter [Paracoccaceae bacterium]MDO8325419.1 MFS transporter [Cypionkella sp.]
MKALTGQAGAVWLLALGQTLTYAGVYYAFPALLPDLQAATGWSVAELAFGPTLGFLVMAALTPFTGAWVDRGWGGAMLSYAPVLAALGVAALGFAPNPLIWSLIWALIGVAQACCLYESCFAFLTRRLGTEARGAITKVTLVAGFAGTLAFPLGDALGRQFGGQGALIAFAGLVLLAALANVHGVRQLRRLQRAQAGRPEPEPGALAAALRRPAFWALAAMFGMLYLNHGILLTYVLMLFEDRGAAAAMAVLAASSIGPAQVLGRLVLLGLGARLSNARAMLWSLTGMVLACVALIAAGVVPGLIFGFAALQGAGVGLLSILRPMLIVDILGRRGFGTISGAVAVAPILASAAAPALGAGLLTLGGPGLIYGVGLGLALGGLGIGVVLLRRG